MAHRNGRHAVTALAIATMVGLTSQAPAQSPAQQTPAQQTPAQQTPDARRRLRPTLIAMQFETASVTQNQSGKNQIYANVPMGAGDWYAPNGGVFSAKNLPLINYLDFAYKVTGNQGQSLASQLPPWALSNRYDIEAQSPDHMATKDQMRLMMRSLLADRFKLAIHTESQRTAIFALLLSAPGKTGPLLQPHPALDASCTRKPSSKQLGIFPATCGGITSMPPRKPGDVRFAARNIDMDLIAGFLSSMGGGFDRPVVDRTGLTGRFDFSLEWAPEPGSRYFSQSGAARDSQAPSPAEALKLQLGLDVQSDIAPVETLVIDHVEQLSAN